MSAGWGGAASYGNDQTEVDVFNLQQFHAAQPPRVAAFDMMQTRITWTLHRSRDSARCVLQALGDRVELHITMTHDVVMSQQCSGLDQAMAVSHAWWRALVNRGWISDQGRVSVRPKAAGDLPPTIRRVDTAELPYY
jgi:hypothetical protein